MFGEDFAWSIYCGLTICPWSMASDWSPASARSVHIYSAGYMKGDTAGLQPLFRLP